MRTAAERRKAEFKARKKNAARNQGLVPDWFQGPKYMCGNHRSIFGPTRREVRAAQDKQEVEYESFC